MTNVFNARDFRTRAGRVSWKPASVFDYMFVLRSAFAFGKINNNNIIIILNFFRLAEVERLPVRYREVS